METSAPESAATPLVSIVLATRDRDHYLPEALESLALQTYPRIEILLVDDGSTDGTLQRLDRFARDHGGRVLRAGGIGPAAARALAFEEATGELLALQDDDDRSHPERIARQVRHLVAHPRIVLLGTAAEIIDGTGRVVAPYPLPLDSVTIRRTLARKAPFVHGSVMMRRSAYLEAGGYRRMFPVAEDVDLYLRLAELGELANLPDPLYQWRLHPGNTLATREQDHFFFHAAARAFHEERAQTGSDSAALLDRLADREAFLAHYPRAGRLLLHMGEAYARVGRGGEARRLLWRALSRSGARAGALRWSALSFAVPLARRARGIGTGGFVVPKPRR